VGFGWAAFNAALPEHFPQKLLEVAMDSEVWPDGGFVKFGGVDIDLDLKSARRKRMPVITGLPNIEPGSEDQQKIGALDGEVSSAIADRALASAEEWVAGRDEVMRPSGGHRDTQPVDEFVKFRKRMSGADSGAGENYGALGLFDAVESFPAKGLELGQTAADGL
jgi:hypothetical protein